MLYIVYVAIDEEVAEDWAAWMERAHVPDVMATGCFEGATMARDEEADAEGRRAWRIFYRARSAADYERYRHEHAAILQRDHTERYAGRFEARRELLPIAARFEG